MLSNYFLRESIGLLWYWLIFFMVAMVVWGSALITGRYDRALYFILSIPYLAWIRNESLCLEMWFTILMPSYMVPTWYYFSYYLSPLTIISWSFISPPIKVSWYSHSRLFSSWSKCFHLSNKAVVYSPPLSDIYYRAGSVKCTVHLVILNTTPFDLLMPSYNIISIFWAFSSKTCNILFHFPRVYYNSGIP